jgi:PAS domain S-box-containing protein
MKETLPTVENLLQKNKKLEQKISIQQKKIESIANFEFFTRETSDFICVIDLNNYFKEFNLVFIKKLGYSKRELLLNNYIKFVYPDDVTKTINAINELFEGNNSVIFENRIITKKGALLSVQWTSNLNPSKNLVYSIGRDITEIRNIQEKLIASENLLNDAQKIAKIGSWEFNLKTQESVWSKELYNIFEIPYNAVADLYELSLNYLNEEDREILKNKINESLKTKLAYEITHQLHFPDNRKKWVFGTGVPVLNDKGKAVILRGTAQDITEKKRIESEILAKEKEVAAVKEKEREQQINAKFRNYVENAPDGVIVVDKEGHFLEVNPAATKITGYSKSKLIKKALKDLIPPDSLMKIETIFENLSMKETLNDVAQFIHKDGALRHWSIDAVKLSENQVLLFVKDITERIQTTEALKEKEERFRVLVENATEALAVLDWDEKKFISVSQSAQTLFKMTEDELLRTGPLQLSPEYQPNGLLSIDMGTEKISAAIAGEKPSFEWIYLDSAGKSLFCDVRLVRLPAENKKLVRASIIDISERKNAEIKLKESELFLKEAQMIGQLGTYSINLRTEKWARTDLLDAIFGIDADYDLNEETWRALVHPDFIKGLELYFQKEVLKKRNPFNWEYKIIRVNDKAERWVHCIGNLKWDEDDNPSVIVGTMRDITDRKLMELELIRAKEKAEESEKDLYLKYIEYEEVNEELKRTNKELKKAKIQAEEANKAKSDFLSSMSHEIRTPLNGIIGFTDLLMRTNLEKNQLEYMSTVNVSAKTLMEIINDILDFSKIESGKLELHIEDIDLFRLLHQVIDLFKYQANLKNIDLALNIDEKVPQYLYADSIRLKQILVNLISNALKFTDFGHIHLDVELVKEEKNKAHIKFSIKDTGIGIKQYNQKKIFNSFEQEDSATSRKFGGTGLGLAISNLLLGLMNSTLQLNSKYGDGSDFFFFVKFKIAEHQESNFAELTSSVGIPKAKYLNNLEALRILIVEDNKINMFLAKTLVKRIIPNAIILEAMDGKEGIEQFEIYKPDLILMDVQMPIKNGYDASIEIRKHKEGDKIPIIALTAGIMAGEKDKCLEFGMNDYVSKPIVEDDLGVILRKWLPQK